MSPENLEKLKLSVKLSACVRFTDGSLFICQEALEDRIFVNIKNDM